MGRKSVKENKNIYQTSREDAQLSREAASDIMGYVSENRIESIENNESDPHPDEILAMAKAYKKPYLCNYYCSHDCPIGQEYVPSVSESELAPIVVNLVVSLNQLNAMKDRLLEITVDGQVSDNELQDFTRIEKRLDEISTAVSALKLWCQKSVVSGNINEQRLNEARAKEK